MMSINIYLLESSSSNSLGRQETSHANMEKGPSENTSETTVEAQVVQDAQPGLDAQVVEAARLLCAAAAIQQGAAATGGRVLNDFRSSLTPKLVEALVCPQDWIRRSHPTIKLEEYLKELQEIDDALPNLKL